MGLAIVIVIVALLAAGAFWLIRTLTTHASTWQTATAARGFDLQMECPGVLDLPFDMFTKASDRRAWTRLARDDANDCVFLYKFELGAGDSEQKHRRTCALFELPAPLPQTSIRPRRLQTIPPGPTDGPDVTGLDADFNDTFRVQSSDPASVTSFLGTRVTSFLLSADHAATVEIELRDRWMLVVGPAMKSPNDMMDFYEWAGQLRDQFVPDRA